MKKEIYFDNAATTKISEEALDALTRASLEDYGNPSSLHRMGSAAEQLMRNAAETIAETLHCSPKELVFTSGGTEGNNLALTGAALANKRNGNRILTSAVEHPSVANCLQHLVTLGFDVAKLPVKTDGQLDLEVLKTQVTEDTVLFSLMLVNNEIGTIQPVKEAIGIVREISPGCLIHVDAVQAYGKLPIDLRSLKADLLTVSGHKIHGPKGSGFCYVREKTKLVPILLGGGQQGGLRSGTENVPAIAGLAAAAKTACRDLPERAAHLRGLRDLFLAEAKKLEGVTINGGTSEETAAPHIVSLTADGIRSEVLLHSLEDEGIYVSAGSACSSHKRTPSATLSAIGLKRELSESTIRFSFSVLNTEEEVRFCMEVLKDLLPKLRRYQRR